MPGLRLDLLGPIELHLDDQPLAALPTNKALGLLIYLAVEAGHAHRRDALAGLFWANQPEEAARANLRKTLERLRRALGDDQPGRAPYVRVDAQTVQFNLESAGRLDVADYGALLAACQRHPHRHVEACAACHQRLEQALRLYRGDFLSGYFLKDSAAFEEWALVQRERLRRQALGALEALAAYAEALGDYDQARHDVERLLELDAWREEAHQRLMRLLALSGQRSAALAQYAVCRRVLAEELNVEPSAATTELFEQIRAGAAVAEPEGGAERRARRQALPAPLTELIGRGADLAELCERLSDPSQRLITLLGLGGAGKTRLALAVAHELALAFSAGVAFVPLAPLGSAEHLAPAILQALDVPLAGDREATAVLLDYLRPRELLLVLDNIEHLLPATGAVSDDAATAPAQLAALLEQAPQVTVLVTSRERLAMRAEWVYALSGLPCAAVGAEPAAVQLFVQRARQARPADSAAADGPAIARICELVEGLPLAIELAVAGLRGRPAAAVAAELEQGLAALAHGPRDAPARHRSMQAAFEHSWRLLSADEQTAFRRLSVFRGGAAVELAQAVAGANEIMLGSLADKSLVRPAGPGRYELHELLRQFAEEQLAAAGESAAVRAAHLTACVRLAEQAERELYGPGQTEWLQRLALEHGNLRAALHWARDAASLSLGLRLAGNLWYFWYLHGHWPEGTRWLETFLDHPAAGAQPGDEPARALALDGLGVLLWRRGDTAAAAARLDEAQALARRRNDQPLLARAQVHRGLVLFGQGRLVEAEAAFVDSLAIYRALGDPVGISRALHNLGNLAVTQDDNDRAAELYEECLAIYQEREDYSGIALLSLGLATIAQERRNYVRARALNEQSLAYARRLGDQWTEAAALQALGGIAVESGQLEGAAALLDEALALCTLLGEPEGQAMVRSTQGRLALAQGRRAEAAALFQTSLQGYAELNNLFSMASVLEQLADSCAAQPEPAARLLGMAARLRTEANVPVSAYHADTYAALVAALTRALGQAGYAAAFAAGQALPTAEAVAEALALPLPTRTNVTSD